MPSPDPDTLLVDVGTTRVKAAVVRRDTLLTLPAHRTDHHFDVQRSGLRTTWSVDSVRRGLDEVVERSTARHGPSPELRLSAHMRGFAIDTPATGYLTWQDRRCLETGGDGRTAYQRLAAGLPREAFARTGTRLRPDSPLANAYQVALTADRPLRGRFHTLGSLILEHLTGEHVTHVTLAAATGLYDLVRDEWSPELLHFTGLDGLTFPQVTHDLLPVGVAARTGMRVHPELGDNQAAVHGAGADDGSTVVVSVGTAGLVSRVSAAPAPAPGVEVRPYLGASYLHVVSGLPGGSATGPDRADEAAARPFADAVDLLDPAHDARRIVATGGAVDATPGFAAALGRLTGLPTTVDPTHDHSLLGLARLARPATFRPPGTGSRALVHG
ncbi:FGGY family carbohydrate kinase [Micromonospora cathayae]|uniref:FGGY family carbohydrate kinase n=1 Tax=Micromonospora cathayae TaxID=3028804 RepID=A0ABY8A0W5_9ACTN|nr:FGGY family carbohydrate kinase [Micromonospora sp. HUAS 3]WDZ87764.1 FGGY family carbohydrate kinase [Micromonospora sp. HUAS 3]